MKLMYKINLVALAVLVVVGIAIAAAGVSTISSVIYDLNQKLMTREVDNVVATVQDAYDVLVENRLDGVESYIYQAQLDVVTELEKYKYGDTGLLIIVTDGQQVVKHESFEMGQQCNLPHVGTMVMTKNGTMEFIYNGEQRFFSYKYFSQWNWVVILSMTSEEMLDARSRFVGLGAGILLISLVLGAMVFIWFIRRVVAPIRQLAGAATCVSEGKWDAALPQPKGSDEIAQLTRSFKRMAGRLAEMYGSLENNLQQIERSRSALRQSEERYKSLYKEAKETEERYHSLIGSTLDAIVIYDIEGQTTYVNKAFTQMFGWSLKEIVDGVPYVPDSEREVTMQHVRSVTEKGVALKDVDTKRLTKDGDLVDVSISASRFNDHKGDPAGMLVILRDITQRKQATKELREHRDHLEESVNARTVELATAKEQAEAANAAKSDFLARMSHEIRTPLNAVTGLTNIVLKSELTTEQRDYLNKVQIASNNLLEVINDILDFSKVEAGRLELEQHPFDLDQILEQLTDIFSEQLAEKELDLVFSVKPNVPRQLAGDSVRLAQILINLIQNAVKFTESGEIVARVDLVEPVIDDQVTTGSTNGVGRGMLEEKHSGQTVLKFTVSDTGVGIAPDVLPTLFEPFTQADSYLTRSHEGAGLGLAICQRLVELMGGHIGVKSTPGKGSVFSFTVTLEARSEVPEVLVPHREHEPAVLPIQHLAGHRVLVVEDSELNRDVAVALLEEAGLIVEIAENGKVAVDKVSASPKGYYDVVLMDIQMPVMDGYEATHRIREWEFKVQSSEFKFHEEFTGHRQPAIDNQSSASIRRIPIIALTAHALKGEKEKCLAAEMDDYLAKPLDEKELHRVLLKWIASE